MIKKASLILVCFFLLSCYESPQVDFHSYQELSEYNFIGNGWFPEILGKDAYGIQETYDSNNHHLFGKFDFTFRSGYDSIMKSYPVLEEDSLLKRIEEIKKPHCPAWFISKEELVNNHYIRVKHNNFYLVMNKKVNRIYFLR